MPVIFVSHGAPTLALETSAASSFLTTWGEQLPRPKAILAVSAHWETAAPASSVAAAPETIHDFYGFPEALYRLRYPAPGAPGLARRALVLLQAAGFDGREDAGRGLDHGAWNPLYLMYPAADIPVTQLSLQTQRGAEYHWRLGEALAPLRDEGVLIFCSGAMTHNIASFRGHGRDDALEPWALAFATWGEGAVNRGDRESLINYRRLAPYGVQNHPSEEHYLPLLVAAGAAGSAGRRVHSSPNYGVLAMDMYQFD
jgi:4,5-DOPA dioxygenase extradiol